MEKTQLYKFLRAIGYIICQLAESRGFNIRTTIVIDPFYIRHNGLRVAVTEVTYYSGDDSIPTLILRSANTKVNAEDVSLKTLVRLREELTKKMKSPTLRRRKEMIAYIDT